MYVELWDLIGRKYTDPEDDEYAMLVSKDGVHIANAVEILFSKAKGEGRICEYNIEIPCVFDTIGVEMVYVLIVSWINADGSLGTYYTEVCH